MTPPLETPQGRGLPQGLPRDLPRVLVLVTGGTVTMRPAAGGGIVPSVDGAELLAGLDLSGVAQVTVATPFLKPGAALTMADLSGLLRGLRAGEHGPQDGVVLVQGTDTIEETAVFCDLLHAGPETIVVTGAMRGAAAAGADGPANLSAAIRVAASGAARGLGALVVLGDTVHAARRVAKGHTALPSAFSSPGAGPVGILAEDRVHILARPVRPAPAGLDPDRFGRVAIVKPALDGDDAILRALPGLGYEGAVIEAMGAGHVPEALVPALEALAARMPAVLASRVPGGPVFERTYGFAGSERDLIARGLIPAGWLSPLAARIVLAAGLGAGLDREALGALVRAQGDG